MNWYLDVLKKYAQFSGRARRKEYWFFVLFSAIISLVLMMIDSATGMKVAAGYGLLSSLYSLAVLIPSLAVAVRRLHDTTRSGWWLLIGFIPLIGAIILIIFFVSDSSPETNEYGPNPKSAAA
ncbi:MAG: DUF805 domain-containing protein [Steroidobacteraceae bacterium]